MGFQLPNSNFWFIVKNKCRPPINHMKYQSFIFWPFTFSCVSRVENHWTINCHCWYFRLEPRLGFKVSCSYMCYFHIIVHPPFWDFDFHSNFEQPNVQGSNFQSKRKGLGFNVLFGFYFLSSSIRAWHFYNLHKTLNFVTSFCKMGLLI
jgi:hypothetical protein